MSDAVIMSMVTGVLTLIGTCFTAYIALKMAELNKRAGDAADRVHEVKETLVSSVTNTDIKLEKIYRVNNGALTAQLKINAEQAARIAKDHPMDESAKAAALAAATLYHDHLAGQKLGAK